VCLFVRVCVCVCVCVWSNVTQKSLSMYRVKQCGREGGMQSSREEEIRKKDKKGKKVERSGKEDSERGPKSARLCCGLCQFAICCT
jgi:hypothetical protein